MMRSLHSRRGTAPIIATLVLVMTIYILGLSLVTLGRISDSSSYDTRDRMLNRDAVQGALEAALSDYDDDGTIDGAPGFSSSGAAWDGGYQRVIGRTCLLYRQSLSQPALNRLSLQVLSIVPVSSATQCTPQSIVDLDRDALWMHVTIDTSTGGIVGDGVLPDVVAADRLRPTSSQIEELDSVDLIEEASPVAYWSLDETAGVTFADSAGAFSLTMGGVAPTLNAEGAISSASDTNNGATFAGTQDVSRAGAQPITSTTAFTVTAWVNPSTAAAANRAVFALGDGSESMTFYAQHASQMPAVVSVNGATTTRSADVAIPSGRWSHLAWVYDGTNIRIYMNGSLVALDSLTPGDIGIGNIYLGQDPAGADDYVGILDEVRMYNRALSADEVQDHALAR